MKLYSAIIAILPLSASAFAPASLQATRSTTSLNLQPVTSDSDVVTDSVSSTVLNALTTAELPDKLYFPQEKEFPKVLGGLKIGKRKLCVVTGASSGLGLNAAATLAKTGRHFVVMACRDVEKGKRGACDPFGNNCLSGMRRIYEIENANWKLKLSVLIILLTMITLLL